MRLGPEHPKCLDAETDRLWWQAERVRWSVGGRPAKHDASPCDDCCREFAEAMRAEGRCDGEYPGERGPEPDDKRTTWHPSWAYATEAERVAARRATWRRAGQRRRALQAAT